MRLHTSSLVRALRVNLLAFLHRLIAALTESGLMSKFLDGGSAESWPRTHGIEGGVPPRVPQTDARGAARGGTERGGRGGPSALTPWDVRHALFMLYAGLGLSVASFVLEIVATGAVYVMRRHGVGLHVETWGRARGNQTPCLREQNS